LLAENAAPYQRPDAVLDAIDALPEDWMQRALDPLPKSWINEAGRDALDQWWRGHPRKLRLNDAKSALP
jgi:hypothetical protein